MKLVTDTREFCAKLLEYVAESWEQGNFGEINLRQEALSLRAQNCIDFGGHTMPVQDRFNQIVGHPRCTQCGVELLWDRKKADQALS